MLNYFTSIVCHFFYYRKCIKGKVLLLTGKTWQ
jgi:hypothetical protein